MKTYFEFLNSVKLLCGAYALERLPHELLQLQSHKALLLSDAVLAKIGTLAKVQQALGSVVEALTYTDIPVDSSLTKVNELVALYQNNQCDAIIALGGGSVIDTAKALRLVLSQNSDDLMSLCGVESMKRGASIPFVVIPTTAGTGSECTGVAVIKNEQSQTKMEFVSPYLMPDIAILDPAMTLSLPAKASASTAMDALCHSVEAISGLQANPISSSFAHSAISLISHNVLQVTRKPQDVEARTHMAIASCMAGIAFSNSMVGLVHAIGHVLGAQCRVAHAIAMAILLPHVMRYNISHCAEAYASLLPSLSPQEYARAASKSTEERARISIELIEKLLQELHQACELPLRLRDAGVSEDSFMPIAQDAINDGAIIYNPRSAGIEDIIAILQQAY